MTFLDFLNVVNDSVFINLNVIHGFYNTDGVIYDCSSEQFSGYRDSVAFIPFFNHSVVSFSYYVRDSVFYVVVSS